MALLEMGVRILSIVGKELVEIVRRPGAIASLVLGPFLIMAIFGLGFNGLRRPLDTVIVASPESGLPADAQTYQDLAGGRLRIVAVTPDQAAAEAQLRAGTIDVVIVAPRDVEQTFRAGQPSTIKVEIDATDPYAEGYASLMASEFSAGVNREIIRRVAAEGEGYVVGQGRRRHRARCRRRADPCGAGQHRPLQADRHGLLRSGGPRPGPPAPGRHAHRPVPGPRTDERSHRAVPGGAGQRLGAAGGQGAGTGPVGAGIAAVTVALLVVGLGVPMLGDPGQLAVVIGLLLLASLGVGLLIAMVSDSERQTVQLSLFVLLASVFFSGFVLAIDQFVPAVRAVAYLLPVTHGIRLIQDVMLRGAITEAWQMAALGLIALVTTTASWLLLRRGMTVA